MTRSFSANGRKNPDDDGGLIEIHSGGSGNDWTWGCIAIENSAIDALWQTIGVGDTVVVEP